MKTIRSLLPALLMAGSLALPFMPAPVAAQSGERVLIIYGNDKCPTSNGEEIVVCSRRPEGERYRIPQELRRSETRASETWGDRAASLEYVGRSGTQSCSASGSGGASGCYRELARKACDEHKADGKKCGIKF